MATNFIKNGKVYSHTAGGTISSGDAIVVGSLLGIALTDATSGESVELAIEGVFNIPKADADSINAGELVHYDVSADEIRAVGATLASGDLNGCGVAFETKGATTGESIQVKLLNSATVT